MFIDNRTRMLHILDAARDAVSFAENRTRNDLDTDKMLSLALVRCLEIIGEASSRIAKQRRDELSHIEWSKMVGMRNRMIHAYFDIDLDIVWDTVTMDLPVIIAQLEEIIQSEPEG
ncbi:MAG TPA: DUF86 domain-containing protein [Oscillatoriaceae cyanobacterium M33_DOE_052]|uniref:DUF86 domain-containing protein n=1 Tax=Planktothricoides sp. SpSt-374 TaxID=2282167 RepID=A0A7C3VM62_9CYAN|nr:DUF86 domain-containing protein [Oscillatoriaceae cyanobacterium M33_DOE_052]